MFLVLGSFNKMWDDKEALPRSICLVSVTNIV